MEAQLGSPTGVLLGESLILSDPRSWSVMWLEGLAGG